MTTTTRSKGQLARATAAATDHAPRTRAALALILALFVVSGGARVEARTSQRDRERSSRGAGASTAPRNQPRRSVPRRHIVRPYGRGVIDFGGAAAFGSGPEGGFAFTFGLNFGYFVLPGLEPGLQTDLTVGSGIDAQWTALPYLRWVLYRSHRFSPYIKAAGGGLFVFGSDETLKLGLYGGGGGMIIGLGGRLALNIEGLIFKIMPKDKCPAGDCTLYRIGFSLSVLFGGTSPPRRQPPPAGAPPFGAPSSAPAREPGNPRHRPAGPGEVPTPAPDEPGVG